MKIIRLIFILILTINLSCKESKIELNESLTDFSQKLSGIKSDELKKITTENGFESLMSWSDSLKNHRFLNRLSENLKNGGNGVFEKTYLDSLIVLSLGKSDDILGATNGYLILKKTKNGYKIEEFSGGL